MIVPTPAGEPVPVVAIIAPAVSVEPVSTVHEGLVPPPLVKVQVGAVPLTFNDCTTGVLVNEFSSCVSKFKVAVPLQPEEPFVIVTLAWITAPPDKLPASQVGVPPVQLWLVIQQAGFTP